MWCNTSSRRKCLFELNRWRNQRNSNVINTKTVISDHWLQRDHWKMQHTFAKMLANYRKQKKVVRISSVSLLMCFVCLPTSFPVFISEKDFASSRKTRIFYWIHYIKYLWIYGVLWGSTLASHLEGPGFQSTSWTDAFLCGSLHVLPVPCVGFLRVILLPSTVQCHLVRLG